MLTCPGSAPKLSTDWHLKEARARRTARRIINNVDRSRLRLFSAAKSLAELLRCHAMHLLKRSGMLKQSISCEGS